ncbi:MAG: hypothetical protein ABSA18_12110 [Dehalococcoidia bacterium]
MSMKEIMRITKGRGRTRIHLSLFFMGSDIVLFVYNKNAHCGAVSIAEFDHAEKRSSVSVFTRLGHKDDAIAQQAAYLISKTFRCTCCVMAGVHVDSITKQEIAIVLKNTNAAIDDLLKELSELNTVRTE